MTNTSSEKESSLEEEKNPDYKYSARLSLYAKRNHNHWVSQTPEEFITYPRLKRLEYLKESKLIALAQNGDIKARNLIWMHYARLTFSVINCFKIPDHLLSDAIQEGCMGILHAIKKFDVQRLNSFSTYAWGWIFSKIQRFLEGNLFLVRLPSHVIRLYFKLLRKLKRCKDLKEEIELFETFGSESMNSKTNFYRVYCLTHIDSMQTIKRKHHPVWFEKDAVVDKDIQSFCQNALNTLRYRERLIIELRYGFYDKKPKSLQEIGLQLNLTRERIRQIQEKAEEKLLRRFKRFCHLVDLQPPPEDKEIFCDFQKNPRHENLDKINSVDADQ